MLKPGTWVTKSSTGYAKRLLTEWAGGGRQPDISFSWEPASGANAGVLAPPRVT